MIFVFGSNTKGIHGAGAAKDAYINHDAEWGKYYGLSGNSFAIPTVDARTKDWNKVPLIAIQHYVQLFIDYAKLHPELEFQVTRIGCGLAGYKDEEIAPFFKNAPWNCLFDTKWEPFFQNLKNEFRYWGTF